MKALAFGALVLLMGCSSMATKAVYAPKIIALDDSNVSNLIKMGCPKEKLSKLGSYGYEGADVPDPYFFHGFEGFEKVYEMIEVCVKNLLHESSI